MWLILYLIMNTKKQTGFTVVELIIIIVVIGILATLTIVGYNTAQKQAREGAVIADLTGAAEQLELYEINTKSYPSTLAQVNGGEGVPMGEDTSYQYSSTTGSYCLTGTNGNVSFKISDTAPKPTAGGCPGHGVAGVPPITNLVVNPSMASTANVSAAGAAGTNAVSTATPYSGPNFIRRTFSASGSGGPYFNPVTPITGGKSYTASVYVRSSKSANIRINIEWKTATGMIGSSGSTHSVSPGSWTRLSTPGNAPSSADRVTVTVYNTAATWVTGDYIDIDAAMLTEGSSLTAYADGNSPDWIWNGTVNNSTSTGPAS